LIVDGVFFGQHALMQDARNENAATLLTVKHDVLAMLMAAQGWANVITKSAQRRIVGKCLAASFKLAILLVKCPRKSGRRLFSLRQRTIAASS
jgi:hypothetical protein